jgi:phage shock protein A
MALAETWRRQSEETERLKDSLRQLNDKIEEAKRKKNLLVAKQKRAQAQKRIHETMAGLNDQSAFATFERMAEKIEESERRALAASEVSQALGDSLEQEFAKLKPADDSVDFRLLELKQKMGIGLPSGSRGALPGGAGQQGNGETKRLGTGGAGDDHVVHDAEIEEEA